MTTVRRSKKKSGLLMLLSKHPLVQICVAVAGILVLAILLFRLDAFPQQHEQSRRKQRPRAVLLSPETLALRNRLDYRQQQQQQQDINYNNNNNLRGADINNEMNNNNNNININNNVNNVLADEPNDDRNGQQQQVEQDNNNHDTLQQQQQQDQQQQEVEDVNIAGDEVTTTEKTTERLVNQAGEDTTTKDDNSLKLDTAISNDHINNIHNDNDNQQQQQPDKDNEKEEKSRFFVFEVANLQPKSSSDTLTSSTSTTGRFVVQTRPDWAPLGVRRLHELIDQRFYDDNRFFRVLPHFCVQFGINGMPDVQAHWRRGQQLPDDPVVHTNAAGTVTFATSGPNTRTTQLFINKRDNAYLDKEGFAPVAIVVSGMKETVERIVSEYKEQPQQGRIVKEGNEYLNAQFPHLSYITSVYEITEAQVADYS